MIRVVIADDEAPARLKLTRWFGMQADVLVVGEAADGLAAVQALDSQRPDLLLLDIRMPGLSGIELAAQLDPAIAPLLVFITAYDEYAVTAFELAALDYLLKPFDNARLAKMLDRVRARLRSGASAESAVHVENAVQVAQRLQQARGPLTRLVVPAGEHLQVIAVDAIDWIESDDNYVHLHLAQKRHTLRRPLQELLAQLDPDRFVRIHKSVAVNISAIATLEPLFKGDHEVTLHSGKVLRLSRRFKAGLFTRLGRTVPLAP
ncbi:MAG TPA: response regulator [Hyphomicrobiales bacterium]|nr:response regulator [Hyphomicrobiales bacterium]